MWPSIAGIHISNSLYYVFSTTSQVLAAFIALSSVFVIFKMQELKKLQFVQVRFFYNYLNQVRGLQMTSFHDCPVIATALKTLHQSECLGGMAEEMDKILGDENVQRSPELTSLKKMKFIFDNVGVVGATLLRLTEYSVISGLVTIVFALGVLVFVPWIDLNVSVFLYLAGLFGLIFSMVSMIRVILISLREKNYITNKGANH